MRKITCIFLVLVLVLNMTPHAWGTEHSIFTTATGYTAAADVEYVTVDGTVVNWGARGEEATFLTTYAENYYTGDYAWDVLSVLSGGTGTSDAYSSDLYDALQDMMKTNHTTIQGYQDTRQYYQYTDCVSSDYSQLSSFYSGEMVNGVWDSGKTYNREHIWPRSKCVNQDKKEDSADIMMLRPTISSENTSRGNTAYGESDGFFDPGVDVHGDCARMVLYGYVRWGNTDYMWGSSGVMENLQILLQWMEEDPVDTWEMGRNDAVESITGVRNVFVDYPEYAWLLFGQEIPENMVTPSGLANQESTSPCDHANTELRDAEDATCTTDGYTGETYCVDCGQLLTEGEAVPATGHSYVDGVCELCGEKNNTVSSGTCGENLTWVLDQDGILTISGSGWMDHYNDGDNQAPWADCREQILGVVLDGDIAIGCYAFWNCANMVTFQSSHPWIVEEGSFYNCQSLKKITIYGFADHAMGAFMDCSGLEEVILEEGVTEIKMDSFNGCSFLRVVTFPESLETIDSWAFTGCALTTLILPEGVTGIGDMAFQDCRSLQTVVLPKSLTNLSFGVFDSCSSLETVYIQSAEIAEYAKKDTDEAEFFDQIGLRNATTLCFAQDITYDVDYFTEIRPCVSETEYDGVQYTAYSYHVKGEILDHKEADCERGYTTYLCETCGEVYQDDFTDPNHQFVNGVCELCGEVERLTFGDCGFYVTWVLTADGVLTISGTGEMDIGWIAPWYDWRDRITSVVIEASVAGIDRNAFRDIANLTGIWVDADNPNYSSDANGVLFNKDQTTLLLAPRGLTGTYVVPSSVTRIAGEAFLECEGLTDITIPDSVTSVEDFAFSGCSSLTEIYFEGDTPSFGECAFEGVSATAYYPAGNDTWTEDVMLSYGGSITWAFYEPEAEEPGDDDGETDDVVYDIPEDGSVVIPENDCFEPDTVVTVEKVEDGETYETANQIMETVAEEYVIFEINATKDNVEVQPNGSLLVTFAIPEGFSDYIAVYYMAEDGFLELLTITLNAENRTVSVELAHFSTYILVDMETQVEQILMGDANGDGVVNYLDAMLIAQYYVGLIGDDALDVNAADVNGDGTVDYLDAMMVAQFYVGILDSFG